MKRQALLFEAPVVEKDIVYTPAHVAKGIVDFLAPNGVCLDPCKGDGAFFNYLPEGKQYCEIAEGKDFFDWKEKVDWVIGNPPYSIFKDFLTKSFEIADNVSFLVPTNKVFQRQVIMEMINEYGGLRSVIVFGSGTLIDFPFGFSVGNFHFKKNWRGDCSYQLGMKSFKQLRKAA